MADEKSTRRALSVRTRFEIFKRDDFACQYCGRRSPAVVLQIDHIVPVSDGGTDDPINLVTACWDCNSGKSAVPLNEIMTGEDPHDRAIMLLERERQLREYNIVLEDVAVRVADDLRALSSYWRSNSGRLAAADVTRLQRLLQTLPSQTIANAMGIAVRNKKTDGLAYVNVVLKNLAS